MLDAATEDRFVVPMFHTESFRSVYTSFLKEFSVLFIGHQRHSILLSYKIVATLA
jgi:hypothetical protein